MFFLINLKYAVEISNKIKQHFICGQTFHFIIFFPTTTAIASI